MIRTGGRFAARTRAAAAVRRADELPRTQDQAIFEAWQSEEDLYPAGMDWTSCSQREFPAVYDEIQQEIAKGADPAALPIDPPPEE